MTEYDGKLRNSTSDPGNQRKHVEDEVTRKRSTGISKRDNDLMDKIEKP